MLVLIAKAVFTFFKDMRKNLLSYMLMIASFLLVLLTNVRVIYIILATIVIACVAARLKQIYDKKVLHSVGTPEYYNERIGRTLEKDEYVRENTVYPHDLNDKSGDLQNSINILSPIAPTKSDEGGEEK